MLKEGSDDAEEDDDDDDYDDDDDDVSAVLGSSGQAGACTPSSVQGYDCEVAVLNGGATVRYTLPSSADTEVNFAVDSMGTGWAALAFPSPQSPTSMVGSIAVLGWVSPAGAADVQVYSLEGTAVSGIKPVTGRRRSLLQAGQANVAASISNLAVQEASGVTRVSFTRALDASSFSASSPSIPMLVAYHPTVDGLAQHQSNGKGAFLLSLAGTAAGPAGPGQANAAVEGVPVEGEQPVAIASSGACVPSSLQGYDCQVALLNGAATFHHTVPSAQDTDVLMAVESTGSGWASLAFADPQSPTAMVGATAVIGWATPSGVADVQVYALESTSVSGVRPISAPRRSLLQTGQADIAASISNLAVQEVGGATRVSFARALNGESFTAASQDVPMLVAYHPSADGLAQHPLNAMAAFTFSPMGGAGNEVLGDDNEDLYEVHGWLMVIGWGVLVPLGVIAASTLKDLGKTWFYLHMGLNVFGIIAATVSFAISVATFDSPDELGHRQLGIAVMVLGYFQPLNALLRPHPPKKDETPSTLRVIWQWLHKGLGRIVLVLAFANIFWGIEVYGDDYGNKKANYIGFGVWLGVLAVLWLVLAGRAQALKRRKAKQAGEHAHVDPTTGTVVADGTTNGTSV